MGQNDVNSSSEVIQPERALSQTNILVRKKICQNKTSPKYQNEKKRFRESMQCPEFKKNRKRIKMAEGLEDSTVQDILSNMDLYNECELKTDKNTTASSSVISTEELNCNATVSLPSLDVPDFLLKKHAQKHVALSGDEQESQSHFAPFNVNDEKPELKENSVLESKTVEPHADVSNTVDDDSVVEMLVGEKITNCSNNTAGDMQGGKIASKEKAVSKTGKKLQFSCQRTVPFSGKNIWPHESCARTSLWFCKNHATGLEFLRGTDYFANSVQMELHKQLVDTTEQPANKIMGCKTELSVKSPTAESQLDIHTAFSGTGNKNGISSTDMERPKQSKVTKNAKKYKLTLNSPEKSIKNGEIITKRNVSIDAMFVDNSKNKIKALISHQKTAVPQVLKTLSMTKLSNFKIPLLKDKSVYRKERNCYNPLNIVDDDKASVRKDRSKRVSSDINFEHLFHSEQINGVTVAAVEEHAGQFDCRASRSLRESSFYNNNLTTSLESDLELALKDMSNLSTGCTKKSTESSSVSSEINKDNWSNTLTQTKDKFYADVLKAYEDDALVIDVIQDDPDLFGNTDEMKITDIKEHFTDNCSITISLQEKLDLNFESSPLPRIILSKFCPRESPIQVHDTPGSAMDVPASLIEVDDGTKSGSLNGTSLTRGSTELSEDGQLTESEDLVRSSDSDEKFTFSEEIVAVKEIANIQEKEKIKNTECQHVNLDHQVEVPLRPVKAVAAPRQGTVAIPWINGPLMLSSYTNSRESWKVEKNGMTYLGLNVPRGYCRSHFNTLIGCGRPKCWYGHVPEAGDEKLCNEILKKYIRIGEVVLLQRAVQIFTDFFSDVTRGVHLDSQMLNNLLISLLQYCLLKELFHILHTCLLIKAMPAVDILLKVFERVASLKLKEVVPELIDISYKLIDDGMVLEYEHFGCISKFLSQLQVSSQEITTFMSRFQGSHFYKASICDFGSAIAEFQHCKEKGDWTNLGIVYVNVRKGCKSFDDLAKYSLYVANILSDSAKEERPGVPFCEFAAAVNAEPWHSEADKTLLGRMGISVLYSYYRIQQWLKARKILDTLHALQIRFTYLKGLIGPERLAPQCQIVNVAVEVFLNSGSLDGAVWILKESEWVINTLTWPCDKMDVLNRHNLLCKIASEYLTKNRYREAFEVLRNLPGFQTSCDRLDVSQYSLLFNKLLGASSENKSLGISSAVVDFMLAKKIPVDFQLLRSFITALGRSCLWLKARTYYRSALALGCYPPLQGNLYRKLLQIPSYITEIEMLLAIEIFLVSNASNIQSPGASNQILQIVLKRCEGDSVQNKDDYQSAMGRLIQATQLAAPKLFLKHLTVNITQEQVYSLEHACVLKWLKDNMKWAGKVWLFQ
ncbi:protein TOPAZ1 [Eublepharis macularius]|uniref:Protein TOPAZ1 n=1 Tax=Eublepharis macularius TaxID=481883 RepID=A0AA97L991_EUBMA|nr:protein TOPAZ1 [Eublepharis macularius]